MAAQLGRFFGDLHVGGDGVLVAARVQQGIAEEVADLVSLGVELQIFSVEIDGLVVLLFIDVEGC